MLGRYWRCWRPCGIADGIPACFSPVVVIAQYVGPIRLIWQSKLIKSNMCLIIIMCIYEAHVDMFPSGLYGSRIAFARAWLWFRGIFHIIIIEIFNLAIRQDIYGIKISHNSMNKLLETKHAEREVIWISKNKATRSHRYKVFKKTERTLEQKFFSGRLVDKWNGLDNSTVSVDGVTASKRKLENWDIESSMLIAVILTQNRINVFLTIKNSCHVMLIFCSYVTKRVSKQVKSRDTSVVLCTLRL